FLQRDSRARPRRHRGRGGLPLSRRIDPPLPATRRLCRDDAGGRLCPRVVSTHERRHRRAAFGLAVVTVHTERNAPPGSTPSLTPPVSATPVSCARARAFSRASPPRCCRRRRAPPCASRG